MTQIQCPNCANPVSPDAPAVRMMTCGACGSTLFLDDAQARLAGGQGVMHDAPMLFGLGDTIRLGGRRLRLLGHARFSYGRGFWDEFWALDSQEAPCWVSLDEGDIVLQRSLAPRGWPRYDGYLKLGSTVTHDGLTYTVTEVDEAECTGLRGSFGHALQVGERYRFVNLTGDDGSFLSGEFLGGSQEWYLGHWFDPFEAEVLS